MPVFKINGIQFNCEIEGQGEGLILIMGLGASQKLWKPQVRFFKKYFQVITYDARNTDDAGGQERPNTTRAMAEVTIKLMDHMGLSQAHILGTSMGGMIAQELAINYPTRISSLVLASTYASLKDPVSGPTREITQMVKPGGSNFGIDFINLSYNKKLYKLPIILKIKWRSKFKKSRGKTSGNGAFKRQIECCLTHHTLDRLSRIQVPTLVITGSGDRTIKPSSSETIARLISNSRLVFLKNGSHFMNVEMAGAFNREILKFLRSLQSNKEYSASDRSNHERSVF